LPLSGVPSLWGSLSLGFPLSKRTYEIAEDIGIGPGLQKTKRSRKEQKNI
jgi:hypothetical protein